jgi:hypothetical protein
MVYDYSELVQKTRQWAEQAGLSGWINNSVATEISQFDSRKPDAFFSNSDVTVGAVTRPLIVAFMGGTGVGKSSLPVLVLRGQLPERLLYIIITVLLSINYRRICHYLALMFLSMTMRVIKV